MKRNFSINLYGTLYNIDEDAYELLQQYEDNMRRYFSHESDGAEICNDIEHRVAELISELSEQAARPVTIEHVQEIVRRIGNPAEVAGSDDAPSTDCGQSSASDAQPASSAPDADERVSSAGERLSSTLGDYSQRVLSRKLYRSPNDKILGGVVSGMATYFGTSATLLRIIIALLIIVSLPISLLIYLVLWAIIPEARTPEDHLRMRGEEVSQQSVSEELLRQNATAAGGASTTPSTPEARSVLSGCFKGFLIVGGIVTFLCFSMAALTFFALQLSDMPTFLFTETDNTAFSQVLHDFAPNFFLLMAIASTCGMLWSGIATWGLTRLFRDGEPMSVTRRRTLTFTGVAAFLLMIFLYIFAGLQMAHSVIECDKVLDERFAAQQAEQEALMGEEVLSSYLDPGTYILTLDTDSLATGDSLALFYQQEEDSVRTSVKPGETFSVNGGIVTYGSTHNPDHHAIFIEKAQ